MADDDDWWSVNRDLEDEQLSPEQQRSCAPNQSQGPNAWRWSVALKIYRFALYMVHWVVLISVLHLLWDIVKGRSVLESVLLSLAVILTSRDVQLLLYGIANALVYSLGSLTTMRMLFGLGVFTILILGSWTLAIVTGAMVYRMFDESLWIAIAAGVTTKFLGKVIGVIYLAIGATALQRRDPLFA